ncbi:hypothetical protein CPLU01_06646 [Colletotrichum plurivorum]|uniref:Uncharacterized protein n=1 Tax=Colletotrichum plurivorum TaxID=2175906 RepID=A0A8H6KHK5_9PEZI|nr:hypothetical protein CPLU01_06646 [Colletotrichum plurivorum]
MDENWRHPETVAHPGIPSHTTHEVPHCPPVVSTIKSTQPLTVQGTPPRNDATLRPVLRAPCPRHFTSRDGPSMRTDAPRPNPPKTNPCRRSPGPAPTFLRVEQASRPPSRTHTLRFAKSVWALLLFLKRPEPPFQDWGTSVPNTSPPCPSRTCPDVLFPFAH